VVLVVKVVVVVVVVAEYKVTTSDALKDLEVARN
jgi:hypothetical protein